MGDLTGKRIDLTYDGILKTSDEGPLTGVVKTIQDGLGNNSGLQMAQAGGNYTTVITSDSVYTNGLTVGNTGTAFGGTVDFQTSSVDFTNANIIGLPDDNTTYDLDTIQSIGQIELNLNGSDASQSTLVISEGSNVTLIDDAGAGFTISATDTNTTYTLDSAQSGANVEIQLDGSDATTDFVTLVAGTNITLTEAGGNVTIDAAGGGGSPSSYTFSTGVTSTWVGPVSQDVILASILVPANTVTKAGSMEWRAPLLDGSEGQWNYTSVNVSASPTSPDFSQLYWTGAQSVTGGGDPHMWYRSFVIANDLTVWFKDTNGYFWPGSGGDPAQNQPVNWSVDQYFNITVWCDAANAKFSIYSPTLTIFQ